MYLWLLSLLLLHPGHATRVELELSPTRSIEVAMRLDAADVESALKRLSGNAVDVAAWNDQEAQHWLSKYLQKTWLIDGEKLTPEQFNWVGWEREQGQVWVYFELKLAKPGTKTVRLQIQSLFEVEPEVQHVVVDRTQDSVTTRIIRSPEKSISLTL